MALKDIVKHNLRRFGLDVIRHPPALPLVHHLREFFAENRIDVVLDVGAYLGLYCRMLRCDVGYKDEIISFEPVSRSFAKLSEEMAEDRAWRGFNFGLSDNTRMVSLNTFGERGDFNSMLMLTEEASDAYRVDHSAATELVQVKTLDNVWDQIFGAKNPRVFMKMDTQGHDTEVFLGSIAHLRSIVGLQSELPAVELYDNMRSMSETLEIYRKHGFVPVGFYPVNRPKAFKGAVPEFDTIFLNVDI